MRRGHFAVWALVCAGSALMACSPGALAASSSVTSGRVSASIGESSWDFAVDDSTGGRLLEEAAGGGGAGVLGFATSAGWFHATSVLSSHRVGSDLVAEVATDDPAGRRLEVHLARRARGSLELRASVSGLPGVIASGIAFETSDDEQFFGFGERSNAVDQRGNEVENYVADGPTPREDQNFVRPTTPPWGARDRPDATYYPIPWMLSSRGYGVLVDRDETSRYDLAAARADRWSVSVDGSVLELRLYAGPKPADALGRFSADVGRQPKPAAPWSFGPWFQTGQPNVVPLAEEAEIIRALREGDAPVSAGETQMHFLPCGAQRDREGYIRRRTRQFHRAGLAHLGYFNPLLCVSYGEVYDRAEAAGVLQLDPTGTRPFTFPAFVGGDGPAGFTEEPLAQFDFSNPKTESFYADLILEAYDAGYDGWMEDFGEYTSPQVRSHDGTPGGQIHNRYPRDYHCTAQRIAAKLDRPLSRHQRSGWTGSARCADIVWGGDPTTRWGFDGISSTLAQGPGMGMSGVARWGSDIGGYFSFGAEQPRPPGYEQPKLTPELLKRWIEVGAVSPVMRTKRSGIAIPSYDRPQVFDPEILPTWRRYTKLHTQLYPYLRAADATYRRTGMPIMRHGILTDPGDRRATREHGQFMFGPALLTAPVVAPDQRRQKIYAPRHSRWLDFWKSVRFVARSGAYRPRRPRLLRGGRAHAQKAPVGKLPMLIKAGSLIPMLPADVDTLAGYGRGSDLVHLSDRRDRMVLMAFPRRRSRAGFYDRGTLVSRELRNGWRLRVADSRRRRWKIAATLGSLRRPFRPRVVRVDGRRLDRHDWNYDAKRTVVRIRTELGKGRSRILVR